MGTDKTNVESDFCESQPFTDRRSGTGTFLPKDDDVD